MPTKTIYALFLALFLVPAGASAKTSETGTDFVWSEGTQTDTAFSMTNAMLATFSPDSKSVIYTIIKPRNAVIQNIPDGMTRTLFRQNECEFCDYFTFSPDGKYIAYMGSGGDSYSYIILADPETGATIHKLESESWKRLTSPSYEQMRFSPDGKYLALQGGNPSPEALELWDTETGKLARTISKSKQHNWRVLFSPDSKYLLVSGYEEYPALFETATGKKLHKFKYTTDWDAALGFSHDSKYAFVSSGIREAHRWEKWNIADDRSDGFSGKTAPGCTVNFVSLMPDDRMAYAFDGYYQRCGHFISIDGKEIGPEIRESVQRLAASADGKYLISVSDDWSVIRLWDIESGKALHTYPFDKKRRVSDLSISPDGKYFLLQDNTHKYDVMIARHSFNDTLKRSMNLPERPKLPAKLQQEQYESKADFTKRVARTKADYEAAVAKYNADIKAGPTAEKLSKAFGDTYGAPAIASVHYDTESGLFTFNVKGDGELPVEGGHEYVFAFKEPVPNERARDFASELKKASPKVTFRLDKGILHTVAATVTIDGKHYSAAPSAEAEQSERQFVEMGSSAEEMASLQPELSITESSANKELAEQARKVAQLRREKAEKEHLEKLKAEAAALEGRGLKTYSSDVDTPNFKGTERADDYALVIGVESYGMKELPKADYAERDADAMKNYLLALGLPERNIKLLKGSDATYAKLKGYLESWLPKNVKEQSRVYVYFSGHGSPEPTSGTAYLLPWDGDPAFLESSAYPLTALYGSLGKLKAKSVVVMLDSCFSGAGGHSVMQKGARPLVVTKSASALPSNMTLLSAASGDEITGGLEEQGHGRFTYYLLKGIYSGIADSAKLCGYMTPEVQNAAAKSNTSQTPVCRGVAADRLR